MLSRQTRLLELESAELVVSEKQPPRYKLAATKSIPPPRRTAPLNPQLARTVRKSSNSSQRCARFLPPGFHSFKFEETRNLGRAAKHLTFEGLAKPQNVRELEGRKGHS